MIQVTPHMKILLAVNPVDFRKGIDGLAGLCLKILHSDPSSGYRLYLSIEGERR
nr:IS66 family insertion sequence element accessory protein TnpB [uncultured Desulfobacter sp.]